MEENTHTITHKFYGTQFLQLYYKAVTSLFIVLHSQTAFFIFALGTVKKTVPKQNEKSGLDTRNYIVHA